MSLLDRKPENTFIPMNWKKARELEEKARLAREAIPIDPELMNTARSYASTYNLDEKAVYEMLARGARIIWDASRNRYILSCNAGNGC